jgi:hypothetical protein
MVKTISLSETEQSTLMSGGKAEKLLGLNRGRLIYERAIGRGPEYLKNGTHFYYTLEAVKSWMKEKNTFTKISPVVKK